MLWSKWNPKSVRRKVISIISKKVFCCCGVFYGYKGRKNKRCRTLRPDVDLRQYFTDTAIRDNIFAIVCPLLTERDITRILCSSKSAFNCNVSFEEARLNLDLLSGKSMRECKKYIAGVSNEMLDQFEPWYFGVAFAFCFKYCTGMPYMQNFR